MGAEAALLIAAQLAGAALAALLASVLLRAYKIVRAPPLLRFGVGSALLSAAQVAAALLEWSAANARALPTRAPGVHDLLFWAYYGTLLAGLGLVLASFERRKLRLALAAAPVLLVAGPIAQLGALALLSLIVVHAGLNHIERARTGSLLTTAGSLLLLVAHALFLFGYAPLTPRHLGGELVALAGLLLLALAALRAWRPRRDA